MASRNGYRCCRVAHIIGDLVDNSIAAAVVEGFDKSRIATNAAAAAVAGAEIRAAGARIAAFAIDRHNDIGAALLFDGVAIQNDDAILHGDAITGQSDNALDEIGAVVPRRFENDDIAACRQRARNATLEQWQPEREGIAAIAIGPFGNEQIVTDEQLRQHRSGRDVERFIDKCSQPQRKQHRQAHQPHKIGQRGLLLFSAGEISSADFRIKAGQAFHAGFGLTRAGRGVKLQLHLPVCSTWRLSPVMALRQDGHMTIDARLAALAAALPSITSLFDTEPQRLATLSLDVAGVHFDFAKLSASAEVVTVLHELAIAADFADWRDRLFGGAIVNTSENRAATHVAERGMGNAADNAAATAGQAAIRAVVEALRADDVRDVLHIGIGGSALGPALLVDALGRDGDGPAIHIVANIDGEALARALAACDPQRTRIIIVSKTFTTTETMTNAATALAWLAAAGVADPHKSCIAVTAAPDLARAFGAGSVLPFAETVGGRYSLWSAVGLPLALRCGWPVWQALHGGAAAMDAHFRDAPAAANAPLLAGLLDVWAARYQGQAVRGVFAYDERLRLLPAFLQQLEMESNGKRVTRAGKPVAAPTAAVTWGGTGTDAQHAVFQLVHQGTVVGPVEFIAVRTPGHDLPATHHHQLLANCFAQGAALLRGRSTAEALAICGGDPVLAAAKTFPGNRPSATLLLDRLDAATLGALLAFYEHRTFAAAVVMEINPFDQMGVELGKEMASAALAGTGLGFDPSTRALMEKARF